MQVSRYGAVLRAFAGHGQCAAKESLACLARVVPPWDLRGSTPPWPPQHDANEQAPTYVTINRPLRGCGMLREVTMQQASVAVLP